MKNLPRRRLRSSTPHADCPHQRLASSPDALAEFSTTPARVFEPLSSPPIQQPPLTAPQARYCLLWVTGFVLAVAYLIWFFREIWIHAIR